MEKPPKLMDHLTQYYRSSYANKNNLENGDKVSRPCSMLNDMKKVVQKLWVQSQAWECVYETIRLKGFPR